MSRENIEFIKSGYAEPRGLTALASRIASDTEFDFTSVYPDQPVLQGIEAMRRFRDEGPWGGSVQFEPERFFDVGEDRVLVFVKVMATGQQSGARVEARSAHEFTFRDGLLIRLKVHADRGEALRAAGLGS